MYRLLLKPFPAALLGVGLSMTAAPPAPATEADAVPNVSREKLSQQPAPPVIERLRAKGLEVRGSGRIGRELWFWLVQTPDGRQAFVATSAEGYLIRGRIYSPDGELYLDIEVNPPLYLNEEDRRANGLPLLTGRAPTARTDLFWMIPKGQDGPKPPVVSGTAWDQLGQATVIDEGKAGAPLVYKYFTKRNQVIFHT